jgi:nucleoside-diphosphate-sugar epimerase
MNVLILGGNRFIGKKLALSLSETCHVTTFNRSGIAIDNINVIQGDRNTYTNGFRGYDIIIDFCLFKPDQAVKLVSQLESKQKYIFISSAAVYTNHGIDNYTEDMPAEGNIEFGSYAQEKAMCEKIVMESDLDFIILRPTYIVGPGSHRPRLSYYFNRIENMSPVNIHGDGNSIIDLVWADDMVNMIIDMMYNWTSRQIYNITGTRCSVINLIEMISQFLQKPLIKNINVSDEECPFPNYQLTAASNKLNKQYIPLKDRMPEFYNWYLHEGKQKHGYE